MERVEVCKSLLELGVVPRRQPLLRGELYGTTSTQCAAERREVEARAQGNFTLGSEKSNL